jgi:hypothetical protein
MTTWTAAGLSHFGDAEEVRVAGERKDGSLRTPVIVWVVRVDDDLYTRSVNGPDAARFGGTRVDEVVTTAVDRQEHLVRGATGRRVGVGGGAGRPRRRVRT